MKPEQILKARNAYTTVDNYMSTVVNKATTLSFRKEPVLITGETGTGKELIARILHGANHNKLVTVNTTAVTDTLFESELFGHKRGAFTGAVADREGLVEYASGGTLFLDEIGDMPLSLQPKILRLIQFGTYRIVGDNETRTTNCRIVAATCANLEHKIKLQQFREDLFYRLSTFILRLTPLRERVCDAVLYVQNNKEKCELAGADLTNLLNYVSSSKLSGNYRELEQIMLRYEVLKELPC